MKLTFKYRSYEGGHEQYWDALLDGERCAHLRLNNRCGEWEIRVDLCDSLEDGVVSFCMFMHHDLKVCKQWLKQDDIKALLVQALRRKKSTSRVVKKLERRVEQIYDIALEKERKRMAPINKKLEEEVAKIPWANTPELKRLRAAKGAT